MKVATQNKAFLGLLQLCVGSILLWAITTADAAGSDDDYYPAPAPEEGSVKPFYDSPTEIYPETPVPVVAETPEPYTEETPSPVGKTPGPTVYYIETTEGGGMEELPTETVSYEEEDDGGIPMDNPEDGTSSCSTYDEDVHAASLLPEMCEWNTYMCCWTGHDGQGTMYGNTDICRVVDYPEEGDVLELPRDEEGAVYCHGFAWPDGADVASHVLPLYHYVKNLNRTEEGGFYGNVEGSPECGCIEEMPIVSDAACTRHGPDGFRECNGNSLRRQYNNKVKEDKGDMDFSLVRECDNEDVPDYDYRSCTHNTYMCCWTENDGQGMADNTDVCRVGQTEYPGESEGEVHCHGFVWPEDATDKYIHLLAQFVQHFDHRDRRGYFGNLPDAPMCGCLEEMPEVSEADCTTYDDTEGREGRFKACTKNDLLTRYLEVYPTGDVPNLVGECDNEVSS